MTNTIPRPSTIIQELGAPVNTDIDMRLANARLAADGDLVDQAVDYAKCIQVHDRVVILENEYEQTYGMSPPASMDDLMTLLRQHLAEGATTIKRIREKAPGGLITNDRGNGSSGPGYIDEKGFGHNNADYLRVWASSEEEDPEAWELLREAARTQPGYSTDIEHVWVSRPINGYQLIIGY